MCLSRCQMVLKHSSAITAPHSKPSSRLYPNQGQSLVPQLRTSSPHQQRSLVTLTTLTHCNWGDARASALVMTTRLQPSCPGADWWQHNEVQRRHFWKRLFSLSSTSTVAAAQEDSAAAASSSIDSSTTTPTPTTTLTDSTTSNSTMMDPMSLYTLDPAVSSNASAEFRPEEASGFDVTILPEDHSISVANDTGGFFSEVFEFLAGIFSSIHEFTGWPWWITIMAVCGAVRICLFPVAARSYRQTLKMVEIRSQIDAIRARSKSIGLNQGQYSHQASSHYNQEMAAIMKKNGVGMFSQFGGMLIQAPTFIALFLTIRHLTIAHADELATGGAAWFTNLSIADPFMILPWISSAMMLSNFELSFWYQRLDAGQKMTTAQRRVQAVLKWGARAFCVVLPYFIGYMPAAIFAYWIMNGLATTMQTVLLRQDFIRKFFDIPLLAKVGHPAQQQRAMSLSVFSQHKVAPTMSKGLAGDPDFAKMVHVKSSRRT